MAELSDRTAEVTTWHVLILTIYAFEKFSANHSLAACSVSLLYTPAFQSSHERTRGVTTGAPLYTVSNHVQTSCHLWGSGRSF